MPSEMFVDSDSEGGNDSGDDGEDGGEETEGLENGNGTASHEDDVKKAKKRKQAQSKKDKRKNKKLKKLGPKQSKGDEKLTTEEIKELTEKEYEQYSNLYNVQIEEVLRESQVPEKRREEALRWVEDLKKFVGGLKSKKFLVKDFAKILDPVRLPLPSGVVPGSQKDVEKDHRWEWMKTQTLQWLSPSAVDIRGSWKTKTELDKVSALDVFLEMPYDYLMKSDILNHKYHVKRAIYLGFLAKKLLKRGDAVKFTLANGERLKPVVSVQIQKVQILIHAVPPSDYFGVKKLTCDKNNLRFEHFFNTSKPEDEPESSTQHYNTTILQDALVNEVQEEMTQFLKKRGSIQNAIKLIKIWLMQRDISKGYGGISGFIVTQLMRYLYSQGRINANMSAFQIIRIFLINLIQMDLTENGIFFCLDSDAIALAQLQWDVIFLNSDGNLNYAANVGKLTYRRIQQEARRALAIIDTGNVAGFSALFLTKVNFMLSFDHVVRLTNIKMLSKVLLNRTEYQPTMLDHSGDLYPLAVSTVGNLLETGLGQRMTMLDYQLPELPEWEVTNQGPFKTKLRFGFNINREQSQKLVEKCESNSDQAIEEFKNFWGEHSELRRFMDGSLLESVTLEDLIPGFGKSRICYQMVSYILKKHLGYKLHQEEYIDRQLEALVEYQYVKLIPSKNFTPKRKVYVKGKLKVIKQKDMATPKELPVSVDEVTRKVSNSFDELSKILRLLEELPLQISTVQGTSSVLRFTHIQPAPPQKYFHCKALTDVDSTKKALLLKKRGKVETIEEMEESDAEIEEIIPNKLPKYVEPVGVIIHLETSGQWPDNMQAIERLKCAFLLKIGELLASKFGLSVQPYPKHLDVLKDGFVFRIRITYFRELTLLKELRGPDGILRVRDNPESLRLEKEALILPQLTSTLHSFHLQYEAFGKTCRLAKRWIASQLLLSSPLEYNRNLEELDCRFSEECVEILVASLFLDYASHLRFPSEAHVGFQRFLALLANTDFRSVPIMVNFNDKITSEELAAIELEFVKTRTTLPSLFICTPFDKKGSVWTRNLSPIILMRAQLLAKQALSVIQQQFDTFSTDCSNLLTIFRPSMDHFDVIIKIKKQMNPRWCQNIVETKNPVRFQEYEKKAQELIPIVDFDPVQLYLQELRNTFGHLAVFLHDTFGGQCIVAVWKPDIYKAVNFTGASVKGRQLGKSGTSITVNVSGVLESFELLGNGLVEEIQTQSDGSKFEN